MKVELCQYLAITIHIYTKWVGSIKLKDPPFKDIKSISVIHTQIKLENNNTVYFDKYK